MQKRNKKGNKNGLNLSYSQKKIKPTNKKNNDSALGLEAGKKTKTGDRMHTSKKIKATKSLPKTREKEKWEIIYTHMYIIQYVTMQAGRTRVGAIMAPSTECLPLDGIYICAKSNALTKSGTT